MQIKNKLRRELKNIRANIENKEVKSSVICQNFLKSNTYKNSNLILCYIALKDEVNTNLIMETAFKDGKTVAVPVCLNNDGLMEFRIIKSFSDLHKGFYGISEPDDTCEKVCSFDDAVCLVPGIAFDQNGYRLGYGKGYYDRFLKNNVSVSAGLCYNNLVVNELPINDFDMKVDFIITEQKVISCM